MKYLLLMALLMGCVNSNKATSEGKTVSEYELKCEAVSYYVYRCENKEVICYQSGYTSEASNQCKFKEQSNNTGEK